MSQAPVPTVPPDWSPCDPFPALKPLRSFLDARGAPDRVRVAYFRRGNETTLLARAWFGPGAEGPPGHAHGGSVAAVLDEALGASAWLAGHQVVVARLVVDFREMVPLGTDATVEASVVAVDGRKVTCRARMTAGATLLAEAEALCVTRDFAALGERILDS